MVERIRSMPVSDCVTENIQRRAWHSRSTMVFEGIAARVCWWFGPFRPSMDIVVVVGVP